MRLSINNRVPLAQKFGVQGDFALWERKIVPVSTSAPRLLRPHLGQFCTQFFSFYCTHFIGRCSFCFSCAYLSNLRAKFQYQYLPSSSAPAATARVTIANCRCFFLLTTTSARLHRPHVALQCFVVNTNSQAEKRALAMGSSSRVDPAKAPLDIYDKDALMQVRLLIMKAICFSHSSLSLSFQSLKTFTLHAQVCCSFVVRTAKWY